MRWWNNTVNGETPVGTTSLDMAVDCDDSSDGTICLLQCVNEDRGRSIQLFQKLP